MSVSARTSVRRACPHPCPHRCAGAAVCNMGSAEWEKKLTVLSKWPNTCGAPGLSATCSAPFDAGSRLWPLPGAHPRRRAPLVARPTSRAESRPHSRDVGHTSSWSRCCSARRGMSDLVDLVGAAPMRSGDEARPRRPQDRPIGKAAGGPAAACRVLGARESMLRPLGHTRRDPNPLAHGASGNLRLPNAAVCLHGDRRHAPPRRRASKLPNSAFDAPQHTTPPPRPLGWQACARSRCKHTRFPKFWTGRPWSHHPVGGGAMAGPATQTTSAELTRFFAVVVPFVAVAPDKKAGEQLVAILVVVILRPRHVRIEAQHKDASMLHRHGGTQDEAAAPPHPFGPKRRPHMSASVSCRTRAQTAR